MGGRTATHLVGRNLGQGAIDLELAKSPVVRTLPAAIADTLEPLVCQKPGLASDKFGENTTETHGWTMTATLPSCVSECP